MPDSNDSPPRRRRLSPLVSVLGLSGVFFLIFLVVSGAIYLNRGANQRTGGGRMFALGAVLGGPGRVGVVEVKGVILDSRRVLEHLKKFEDDPSIRAVVLRLNSPGGAVAPSQEIHAAVKKYKKPLVASMGSVAASGAFYIACGAKKVFANAGTITGSIGVIMEFVNLQKLYEWAKIKRYSVKTGRFKALGAEYEEMSEDGQRILQGMVDDVLGQFRKAVEEGRKLPSADVVAVSDGRIFSGAQAKAAKLVDEIGTFDDAVAEAAKQGDIKGKPTVVYPHKAHSIWWDLALDREAQDGDAESATQIGQGAAIGYLGRLARALGWPSEPQPLPPGVYWLWSAR